LKDTKKGVKKEHFFVHQNNLEFEHLFYNFKDVEFRYNDKNCYKFGEMS